MSPLEKICTEIVDKLRKYAAGDEQIPDKTGLTITAPGELSGLIPCRDLTTRDPAPTKIVWALNSAMRKGIERQGSKSLGYYTFRIKSDADEGVNSVVLSVQHPVTLVHFDRDMARLEKILSGHELSNSR